MKSLVLATLLRVVFEKLAFPILSKFQSHTEFNKKMKKLQDHWLTIQVIIEDAEERQLRDAKVKLRLKKLKDVTYNAGDLLNSITVQALRNNNNKKKNVWNLSAKPIFNRLKMARDLRDIRERLDEIARDMSDFQLRDVFIHRRINTIGDRLETGPYVNESEVFGREDGVEMIVEMLLSSLSSAS